MQRQPGFGSDGELLTSGTLSVQDRLTSAIAWAKRCPPEAREDANQQVAALQQLAQNPRSRLMDPRRIDRSVERIIRTSNRQTTRSRRT